MLLDLHSMLWPSDPLMLVSGGQPLVCAVMTRHSTDGQRMRARMERLVATVSGNGKPPKPTVSMKVGAAAAQLDDGAPQLELVPGQHCEGGRERLEDELGSLETERDVELGRDELSHATGAARA